MKRNEGSIDRVIRVVIAALAIIGAAVVGAGTLWGIVLLVVAGIMLVTAAVGWCPLYSIFGVSTCPVRPQQDVSRDKVGTAS